MYLGKTCTLGPSPRRNSHQVTPHQADRRLDSSSLSSRRRKTDLMEFLSCLLHEADHLMSLKRMMEKLGMAKTHLELKKMMAEVSTTDPNVITYRDFLDMMLGKKSTVLKLILMFEERKTEPPRPSGPAPKRELSSLP
uniref:Allograft inflammatory factor 1-like EF-hand domain-containing protein n=1 Tax=Eptatretus burgeri TaxID=7764 RepID=A0A8C4R6U3_EPTBU